MAFHRTTVERGNSDKQMATMANEAASKAIVNYGVSGKPNQIIEINGVTFKVPIANYKGDRYVPTAFPVNPKDIK